MQITRYADYSIRVLIYLALTQNELTTIQQISDHYHISKNHLMKIVQDLNVRGYITAIRGKNGGIKLKGKPESINLGKLIREIECDSNLVECFGNNNQCVITPSCQLKNIFAEALDSFFTTLVQYTLQDLVNEKHQSPLRNLLSIGLL